MSFLEQKARSGWVEFVEGFDTDLFRAWKKNTVSTQHCWVSKRLLN